MAKMALDFVYKSCNNFFDDCRVKSEFSFKPYIGAESNTLYSSVFAVMAYHYTGKLQKFDRDELSGWANYINEFQNPDDGLFDSHELHEGIGVHHNLEHRKLHLTCHVLPALALLGYKPKYPIKYVEKYTDSENFIKWLDQRDLTMAWVEGNNLLFAGQLLINEIETSGQGQNSLDLLFNWLEDTIDSKTALWGTDKNCSLHKAMYGAYHQLVLYYYKKREVPNIEKLIDSVLLCQHFDGGFSEWRGGGTCQDIDGIDILVNCYKLTSYRRRDIRKALRKSLVHIMNDRYIENGGFQDRKNHEFIHNSMPSTRTAMNVANTFSTWFTLHALNDLGSVLYKDEFFRGAPAFLFNNSCSMGWGYLGKQVSYSEFESKIDYLLFSCKRQAVRAYDLVKN